GHMGRIETLLSASLRLDDEGCREAAHELMDRVCSRAQERGRYELSAARGTDVFAPSLFQGASGVGYTLLRLAAPAELPSLLLFE
ncbi:MAG TPA: lanthionine synthetase LanC family protein, partial [Thermoanaerobaculia bacterium]|nr:lanthionine synthetase LanC family protein [Thermoanaerobaculia bacterium]